MLTSAAFSPRVTTFKDMEAKNYILFDAEPFMGN
jgi:hypothetical protein